MSSRWFRRFGRVLVVLALVEVALLLPFLFSGAALVLYEGRSNQELLRNVSRLAYNLWAGSMHIGGVTEEFFVVGVVFVVLNVAALHFIVGALLISHARLLYNIEHGNLTQRRDDQRSRADVGKTPQYHSRSH